MHQTEIGQLFVVGVLHPFNIESWLLREHAHSKSESESESDGSSYSIIKFVKCYHGVRQIVAFHQYLICSHRRSYCL